ncbi:MAG: glycosyltransferase family 4 protein [Pseudomonadales bacterium]
MNIAHFIATNFVGGPENQIIRHCQALSKQGHKVWLISFDEPGGLSFLGAGATVAQSTLALSPQAGATIGNLRALREYLRQQQIDLVVAHGYKATILAALAQYHGGTPAVAFSRGWTSENWKVRLYEWLDKHFIRLHQRIIAVSHSQRQRLIDCGVPAEKIEVVHNAYLTDNLPVRKQESEPSQSVLLCAGRLSPEKGHRYLIEAFAEVLKQHPRCQLQIAGEGMERSSLESRAKALGVDDNIEFLGFVENMQPLYETAALFVLPSLSEGLPNVILESYYWSLPVVATRVGGVPEIVEDARSGLLCAPEDAQDLARAILQALDDPQASAQRAQTAQTVLIERFGIDRQSELLLQVYQNVVV